MNILSLSVLSMLSFYKWFPLIKPICLIKIDCPDFPPLDIFYQHFQKNQKAVIRPKQVQCESDWTFWHLWAYGILRILFTYGSYLIAVVLYRSVL